KGRIAIVDKDRNGNTDTVQAQELFGADVRGRNVVIFDDEADTLGTIIAAVGILREHGAQEITAACIHGVLSGPAIGRLAELDIKRLVVTDTFPLPDEKIALVKNKIEIVSAVPLFAKAIECLYNEQSLGHFYDY
ncbi:MAG: ribose-phosphate pyrophosphokinase, partial [Candidatus Nomurabacteria bacterium]|nr:ribose-phosphate pyrophosphokinase [Candidatus Nomurabacteria bacterium]